MVQCKMCQVSLARVKGDNITRCIGNCGGVYHTKCASKIKAFIDTGECDECQGLDTAPAIRLDIQKITTEKLLAEVNEKLAIVFNMKKTLETMSEDISFYAEKYQELIEEKEKTDKKIKSLEHRNVHLETCNKALEERITYLEIKEREKNIEIVGLYEESNEQLEIKVQKIAEKLGVDGNMIVEMRRVGEDKVSARRTTANTGHVTTDISNGVENGQRRQNDDIKPRPVIISLKTRSSRDQWLCTRKTHHLVNGDIIQNGSKQRIYVNEDLTKYMRNLLWTAKNELRLKYKYIWVQNNKVLIKKDDPNDTRIRAIRTLQDINVHINQN